MQTGEVICIQTEDMVSVIGSCAPDRERSRDNAEIFEPVLFVPRHTCTLVFEQGKDLLCIHRILPLALTEQDRNSPVDSGQPGRDR
jgi:hypothetical protein